MIEIETTYDRMREAEGGYGERVRDAGGQMGIIARVWGQWLAFGEQRRQEVIGDDLLQIRSSD